MSEQTGSSQRIRRLPVRIQCPTCLSPLPNGLGLGESSSCERDFPGPVPAITWEEYLSEETRNGLLDEYAVERREEGPDTFWQWENTRSVHERLRIYHFEWTYASYTEPAECPIFRLWLTRREIQTRVFRTVVPPFTGGEYQGSKQQAIEYWAADPFEIATLVAKEDCLLLASRRWWTQEHFALLQLYRTLPYDCEQHELHGRWVEKYVG